MEMENVGITVYENQIPSFVEAELERLYAHVYSTLQQLFASESQANNISTYVAEKNGVAAAIFLFRFEKDKVYVLNEQIDIPIEEIDRFTRHILSEYPKIGIVCFNAIRTGPDKSHYPVQRFYCTEDIVLSLPGSDEEYLAMLGKSTRKTINYRMNRLKRDFPSLRCEFYSGDEIRDGDVREIVALNRARMAGKNKVSSLDSYETERIIRLSKWRGLALVLTINGRICAGTICCRVGENYFAHVIGHDPLYDSYRLGTLAAYLTICECIRRGGKEFHFLWGRYEYKYLLLGVNRELYRFTIYRSYLHFLLNGGTAFRIAFAGYLQQAKSSLLESANNQENPSLAGRLSFAVVKSLRSIKQFALGTSLGR